MLLFLGPAEKSRTTLLVQLLEHLTTSVQVLDESTFEVLQPKMDKTTPIVIEQGANVGKHQELLLETIKERNMVIIMADCYEGDLNDYGVAVSPSGKYVAVKYNSKGREQDVLAISEEEPSTRSFSVDHVEELDKPEPEDPEEEPTSTGDDAYARPQASSMQMEEIAVLTQFLEEKSTLKPSADAESYYWQHKTQLTLANFTDTSPDHSKVPDWLNKGLRRGHIKAFCTVEIHLYATKTPRRTWIEFRLTDAVGMNSKMGINDRWAKGYFNRSSKIYLYPGNGSNPHHSSLPAGWHRPSIEPHTPNEATTYHSTTGWSFGVDRGVDPSGPSANVTASYDSNLKRITTIRDFSVRNLSDNSMSGWNFYYTAVDGGKWKNHFWAVKNEPKGIANLAKSTLHMNAEALYEGPPDVSSIFYWSFNQVFEFACLRGNWANKWIYWRTLTFKRRMVIDLAKVRNPKPGHD